ncbi:ImmA/IrrE family metallo-endopeptidase [Irregularibacter muris]|uniref:ImmA/IrrE family metallo-endopeptidase n=1 Tax=Irregularibacter muris TaxID=1796619 RepID=A0AAE3HE61_9FIRM|nr:ImmA/IrrE family metallo-endopeptidase [Irregularibacter muris]MCR1897804.1 ImmA/IrrE family metallo-endopeptidase [Irregularibacter muris]
MKYEALLKLLENKDVEVIEIPLEGDLKGLYADNVIAINKNINTYTEKACVLAEELGHYHTTAGDILDQSKIENRKQELKARRWAVDKLIRIEDFIDAFDAGVQNRAELAEFLGVTENFIETAIDHFKGIYGLSHTIGEYTICFSPLVVYKKFI